MTDRTKSELEIFVNSSPEQKVVRIRITGETMNLREALRVRDKLHEVSSGDHDHYLVYLNTLRRMHRRVVEYLQDLTRSPVNARVILIGVNHQVLNRIYRALGEKMFDVFWFAADDAAVNWVLDRRGKAES